MKSTLSVVVAALCAVIVGASCALMTVLWSAGRVASTVYPIGHVNRGGLAFPIADPIATTPYSTYPAAPSGLVAVDDAQRTIPVVTWIVDLPHEATAEGLVDLGRIGAP